MLFVSMMHGQTNMKFAWNHLVLKKLVVIQLATAIRTFYGTLKVECHV